MHSPFNRDTFGAAKPRPQGRSLLRISDAAAENGVREGPVPIPTFGIHYEQTSTLDWTEGVTCRRCGQAARARVATTGTGYGKAVYGLGREAAKDRAGLSAFEQAVDLARDHIQLARCPRCERRYGGLYWLGIKATFAWTFIAAPVYGMVWAVLLGSDASTSATRASTTLVWGVAIALAVFSFRRKLRTVDHRVRLEPVPAAADALAAPPAGAPAPAVLPPREDDLLDPADHSEGHRHSQESAEATSLDTGLEFDLDRTWNRGK